MKPIIVNNVSAKMFDDNSADGGVAGGNGGDGRDSSDKCVQNK